MEVPCDEKWTTARLLIGQFVQSFESADALLDAMGRQPLQLPQSEASTSTERKSKSKRKRIEDTVGVSPLRIVPTATSTWIATLRQCLNAVDIQDIDGEVKPMIARSNDWRKRIEREIASVEKLVVAMQNDPPDGTEPWPLHGNTYTTSAFGRTMTNYPQLGESTFVQRLSKATRHAITNHCYAEIDLSTAHIAAAWGAVERHFGHDKASNLCPMLKLAATDKARARGTVAHECGCDPAHAKRLILMTLNQESGDGVHRTGFLHDFVHERPMIMEALSNHPSIAGGGVHEQIVQSCTGCDKPSVREMALMLQRLEAEMLRVAVPVLAKNDFEVGAFIADGLLVRPIQDAKDVQDVQDVNGVNARLQNVLDAVQARIQAELHVTATMEIEHKIGNTK